MSIKERRIKAEERAEVEYKKYMKNVYIWTVILSIFLTPITGFLYFIICKTIANNQYSKDCLRC